MVVVEARSVAGGRIRSLPIAHGEGVVEEGAEFIHGELPITNRLIDEAGLTKVKVDGKMFRKEDGRWRAQEEMIEGWDRLLSLMKDESYKTTMLGFMNKNFPADRYGSLRRHIKSYVQGFDVAGVDEISVRSLYEEWSSEDDQFRLKEGYSSLIDFLYRKLIDERCVFHFNTTVTGIRWNTGSVHVHTSSGLEIESDFVIVTLPVSKLSGKPSLAFSPSIDEYLGLYKQIGFGSVIKVVFDFSEQFWQRDLGFIFSREPIPTWWTQFPIKNNLLTGWAGGPDAKLLYSSDNRELEEIGLGCVARIFDTTPDVLRKKLRTAYVFNWKKYPEAGGAYSFATPMSISAREQLTAAVDQTIWFAGEGLVGGSHPGTVEAAFKSGYEAGERVLRLV